MSAGNGDAAYEDRLARFANFFDEIDYHKTEIRKMFDNGKTRYVVSLDDLLSFDKDLKDGVLQSPSDYLPPFINALKDTALAVHDPSKSSWDEAAQFFVGFRGAFGRHFVNPRTIDAAYLGKVVCIEGIVTRCTIVRPKISRSVHYNESAQSFTYKDYRDASTSFDPMPATTTYPTEDGEGNSLTIEYGLSKYRDHQTVSIQEMPERAPPGQLPRSIDVIMDDDLVDSVKPGDRVQIVGIYRSLGSGAQNKSTFRNLIIGLNVAHLGSKGEGSATVPINSEDIRNINMVSKEPDLFDLLARSLAPSIYGFEWIKKAVLLQLIGGVEKNLPNGTHIRGDINILMIGDPSTAKSQMLRFILNTAPLAVATTGRGSTGVGLTAAVVSDPDTGERRLTAGAMVMADRGVVCIDEFDKMNEVDRVAIHEVMEQQTVTVAKAGIHTSLNARCSVIAAANPIYGRYDPHQDPAKNIALPDSLLSRFDLLFVVTDDVVDKHDRAISEHVLNMHKYIPDGLTAGTPQRENARSSLSVAEEADENQEEAPVYEKYTQDLHAGIERTADGQPPKILTIAFLKRYIHYCKTMVNPTLGPEAAEIITEVYANLRNENGEDGRRRTTPITARTLETLIRLATAHAKLRLSKTVEQKDAEAAERILRYALFRTVLRAARNNKKARRDVGDLGSDVSDLEGEESESEEEAQMSDVGTDSEGEDDALQHLTDDDNEDLIADEHPPVPRESRAQRAASRRSTTSSRGVSSHRLNEFRSLVAKALPADDAGLEAISVDDLVTQINRDRGENEFTQTEIEASLNAMAEAGNIQISNGKVYRI